MKNEEVKKTNKKGNSNNAKKTSKKVTEVKEKVIEEVVEENTSIDDTVEVRDNNNKSNTKNKGDLFLILGLVVVVVLGFIVMRDKNAGPSYELPLTLSGEPGLQQLTYTEYQEKIDNGDEFVVIIERATCSHCITYLPVAEKFASDNNVPMYYVDTDTFSSEDWSTFESSNTFFRKTGGEWGTPTTIVLAGNEAVDYIEGETTAENILKLYQEYFDMNEE